MFIAASTDCYHELPLKEALAKLVDVEYSAAELAIFEDGIQLKPSEVFADVDRAIARCRDTHRVDIIAFDVRISAPPPEYYQQFTAICKLAKAIKVVTVTVPSGELGTPFNEEVERLRKLVAIASLEGVRVGVKSQVGCISEDPDTMVVLCDHVKGLGVTLVPSHYLYGTSRMKHMDKLMKYTYHVQLHDSTKDKLQVQVGQGEIEYSKIVTQLRKVKYNRALCVTIRELPGVDQTVELRKMRLFLESLL